MSPFARKIHGGEKGEAKNPESAGIKTTENLIFTPRPLLDDLLPSISAHILEHLIEVCIRLTAGHESDGAREGEEEKGKRAGWGGLGADGLTALVGGWDGVGILELCGQRRVGKSVRPLSSREPNRAKHESKGLMGTKLIALHSALRVLVGDTNSTCQWLDTDGSFSPDRAKIILESWGIPVSHSTTIILGAGRS